MEYTVKIKVEATATITVRADSIEEAIEEAENAYGIVPTDDYEEDEVRVYCVVDEDGDKHYFNDIC